MTKIKVSSDKYLEMGLTDMVSRSLSPIPWEEGDNIPWNEVEFSRRMLKEHLSQNHDAASRRSSKIDKQVNQIHTSLLGGHNSNILDLCCGPGLYTERLARLGHTCRGIDYSPASIEYAISVSQRDNLNCSYSCQDIRNAEFPSNINLIILIYGEFNVFRQEDMGNILDKSWQALTPGGILLLEPHTYQYVKKLGKTAASWYSSTGGLFFDGPHLVLKENFWDDARKTTTIRYYVVQTNTGAVTRYAQTLQAYSNTDYSKLLKDHLFEKIEMRDGLSDEVPQKGFLSIIARK